MFKSIVEKADFDKWESKIYGLPFPLYTYFLDVPTSGIYTSIIGATGDYVFSVMYTPYLEDKDVSTIQIPYDISRFGKLNEVRPELPEKVDVFRIKEINDTPKLLKTVNTYNVNKNIGGKRNWKNESKLYQYPYSLLMLYDGVNQPLTIKPQLSPKQMEIMVKNSISDKCSSSIFVKGYKGDVNGVFEGMVSGGELELPCTSNNYVNFIARSKNQTKQNVESSLSEIVLNNKINNRNLGVSTVTNLINGGANLFSGNLSGGVSALTDIGTGIMNYKNQSDINNLNKENLIKNTLAEIQDKRSMPNTLLSKGDNVFYGLMNNNSSLMLYRYGLTENFGEILGNYFAMYGYLQNRIMKVNTKSRYYYNYISAPDINIKSNKIPSLYLNKLKNIFKSVTIWHVDNDGVVPCDYSMDNKEV